MEDRSMKAAKKETRAALIGGAGFIGSHLADVLLEHGYSVRVADGLDPLVHPDSEPPHYLNPRAEFVQQDVRDREGFRRTLEGAEAVFYLAGVVGVGDSMYRIRHYVETNVLGAANFLDFLANEKHSVKKVVLASSVTVYGEGKYACPKHGTVFPTMRSPEQISQREWELRCPARAGDSACSATLTSLATDEEKPLSPLSLYAITKRTQEEMFLSVGRTYGIPVTVLRFFNVYGSRQALSNPYTGVVKIFASQLAGGKPPLIYEDGLQSRDFVHVRDVVESSRLALEREEANGQIFNVGTGRPTTVLEVAAAVAKHLGRDVRLELSKQHRAGDVRHCWADIAKVRSLLGFEPQRGFPAGVEDLLASSAVQKELGQNEKAHVELEKRGLIS
jgi:dTDP-L-rhamnose 4-epimerase